MLMSRWLASFLLDTILSVGLHAARSAACESGVNGLGEYRDLAQG
jgi:hypothetical protein